MSSVCGSRKDWRTAEVAEIGYAIIGWISGGFYMSTVSTGDRSHSQAPWTLLLDTMTK